MRGEENTGEGVGVPGAGWVVAAFAGVGANATCEGYGFVHGFQRTLSLLVGACIMNIGES